MKDKKIIKKTKLKAKKLCKTKNKIESNKKNLNKILGWPMSLCKDHIHIVLPFGFMEGQGRGPPPCLLCAVLHRALVSAH